MTDIVERLRRALLKRPIDDGSGNIAVCPVWIDQAAAEIELLRTSDAEGWRYAKELEAEIERLREREEKTRTLIANCQASQRDTYPETVYQLSQLLEMNNDQPNRPA